MSVYYSPNNPAGEMFNMDVGFANFHVHIHAEVFN